MTGDAGGQRRARVSMTTGPPDGIVARSRRSNARARRARRTFRCGNSNPRVPLLLVATSRLASPPSDALDPRARFPNVQSRIVRELLTPKRAPRRKRHPDTRGHARCLNWPRRGCKRTLPPTRHPFSTSPRKGQTSGFRDAQTARPNAKTMWWPRRVSCLDGDASDERRVSSLLSAFPRCGVVRSRPRTSRARPGPLTLAEERCVGCHPRARDAATEQTQAQGRRARNARRRWRKGRPR